MRRNLTVGRGVLHGGRLNDTAISTFPSVVALVTGRFHERTCRRLSARIRIGDRDLGATARRDDAHAGERPPRENGEYPRIELRFHGKAYLAKVAPSVSEEHVTTIDRSAATKSRAMPFTKADACRSGL